jgi:bacillithiol biosynthesis deacetylase BshB1
MSEPAEIAHTLDLLAFGPHPDDVELFCGGLVASAVTRGHRVAIVDLTRGERGTRGTVSERAREADEAARILGVASRENLALPDAGLAPHAPGDVDDVTSPVLQVVACVRRLRPTTVLVPFWRERHPDHEAASALITRALFLARLEKVACAGSHAPFSPQTVLYYPMRVAAEPSFVVDVSDVYETKQRAIRAHVSQVGAAAAASGTLVGAPGALLALEARDRLHGSEIGVAYGEPYIVRERMALRDPLAHFTTERTGPAFFFSDRSR